MKAKKIAAVFLLCVLVFSITAAAAMARGAKPDVHSKPEVNIKVKENVEADANVVVQITLNFKDMKDVNWALKQVMKMRFQNMISGYQDGTFRPSKSVTHAEAVVLTMKAAGLEDSVETTTVTASNLPYQDAAKIPFWARKAVALAVEKGYLKADAAEMFEPNKPASREWIVRLAAGTLDLQTSDVLLPFKDVDKIPADIVKYVAFLWEEELISGYPDGNFKPEKPVTRAELAVMLGKFTDELEFPVISKAKVTGTVKDVEIKADGNSQGTITLQTAGNNRTISVPVANSALIYLADQSCELSDVSVGTKAEMILKDGQAVYLEVKPVFVKGVIAEVNAADNELKVYPMGEHRKKHGQAVEAVSYTVYDDAKVSLNGATVELSALQALDRVKMTTGAEGKITLVQAVRPKSEDKDEDDREEKTREIEGTVVTVDADTITLNEEDGKTGTYALASDVEIKIEDEKTPGEIQAGDKVELKIENDKVVKVTVEDREADDEDEQHDDDRQSGHED